MDEPEVTQPEPNPVQEPTPEPTPVPTPTPDPKAEFKSVLKQTFTIYTNGDEDISTDVRDCVKFLTAMWCASFQPGSALFLAVDELTCDVFKTLTK